MAISLGIYPIFRQTHIEKPAECWPKGSWIGMNWGQSPSWGEKKSTSHWKKYPSSGAGWPTNQPGFIKLALRFLTFLGPLELQSILELKIQSVPLAPVTTAFKPKMMGAYQMNIRVTTLYLGHKKVIRSSSGFPPHPRAVVADEIWLSQHGKEL